jgi:hypothetical protein
MASIPSLPVFRDGIVLSASELNRISAAQTFLSESLNAYNFPFTYIHDPADNRHMIHRFRYLHWLVVANTTADFFVGSVNVGKIAQSATSGVIDLGHGYGYTGANPYNLALNRPYLLRWSGADVEMTRLFEHSNNSGNIALPYSNPSFSNGQVLTAAQLNALSQNSQFLYDYGNTVPVAGYVGRRYGLADQGGDAGGAVRIFHTFRKRHRYLHIKCVYNPNGNDTGQYGFNAKLGSTRFYNDGAEYNQVSNYHFVLDMHGGSGNQNYGVGVGSFDAQPAQPAQDSFYTVTVNADSTSSVAGQTGWLRMIYVFEATTNGEI